MVVGLPSSSGWRVRSRVPSFPSEDEYESNRNADRWIGGRKDKLIRHSSDPNVYYWTRSQTRGEHPDI